MEVTLSDNLSDAMPFSKLMGVVIKDAQPDRITGSLLVREDLCTTGGILHGGAIMAFADALGGVGAFLSLPKGAGGTTTVESKTNFLGGAKLGQTVHATTTPVKIGARLSVWQTQIETEDGKQVALVTQTQMVL